MKERARSRKRKAEEVQCQQEEKPQTKKRENGEIVSSSDQPKQKKTEKKHKNLFSGGNEENTFSGFPVCSQEGRKAKKATHSVCGSKEQEQAHQKNDNLNVAGTKLQRKRVRFSDDLGTCKTGWNVSEEVRFQHGSALEESSLNGGAGQANLPVSCSYKKGKNEQVCSQDGTMHLKAHHTRLSKDEKDSSTRKRQKDKNDEVWGKRFTPKEDAVLKCAILEYIKVQGWEEKEGIDKVLNCCKHKKARKCWGVIRLCLPHRPRQAVRNRAYRLFEEYTDGNWSKEEEELLKREHGNQWKDLSTMMGRSQYSIKQKWRCLKRPNPTGVWTWREMQQLSDLVHTCVRLQALGMEDRKINHKILRDNVSCWDKIADAIGTHNHNSCCFKWYGNLTSTMVMDGLWASEDDYLLLKGLLESGACTEEEVEWQRLLNHRSGQTCFVRWKQMVKHLGENRTREFLEKLNGLLHRYAPELLSHE